MILQALYRLAERERLMADPDYEPKPVAWLVRVTPDGRLLGIEDTRTIPSVSGTRAPSPVAKHYSVPREKPRTSGDRAFFLYDKAEYVFGIDPDGKREKSKLAKRSALFRGRIAHCAEATKDEGVLAVQRFLEAVAGGRQEVTVPEDCRTNDLFAFVFDPDVDRLVSDREKVREYWKDLRSEKSEDEDAEHQCLVSGRSFRGEPQNFPQLKKVPGGSSSGVGLVSFNSTAFESYGWRSNQNAPISRDAAEACATALNRLLDPAYPDPETPGQTLPERRCRLSADTVVCFWAADRNGDAFCGIFRGLMDANPNEVKDMYQSIWNGRMPEIEDPSAFYALTITGTQGRAIVRDWFESTVAETARNMARHFEDIRIVRNTPKPKNRELPPTFALSRFIASLAPRGDSSQAPSHLIGRMVKSVLQGMPYPRAVLQRAIERYRAEIGGDAWADKDRQDARAALIKGVLNRQLRRDGGSHRYREVLVDMDPENGDHGYLLGRLLAVIERMQQVAMGDLNATVIDRYFSGASATPAAVFPRLLKNFHNHARKAKDASSNAGTAGWLEGQIDDILSRVDGFPTFLNLEKQGLFILGYHHQRKWLWTKKEDREGAGGTS